MGLLWERLRRSRLLGEVSVALHGAVVGALAGVVVAAMAALLFAPHDRPTDRFATAAAGLGYGWWGGLLVTVALAMAARRAVSPPSLGALTRAMNIAGAATVFAAAATLAAGVAASVAILIAVAAGVLAARLALVVLTRPTP